MALCRSHKYRIAAEGCLIKTSQQIYFVDAFLSNGLNGKSFLRNFLKNIVIARILPLCAEALNPVFNKEKV